MFCSATCRNEANFHQYECPIIDLIKELTDNMQLALRTFFIALAIHENSIEKLMKFIDTHETTTVLESSLKDELAKLSLIISFDGNNSLPVVDEIFDYLFKLDEKLSKMWSKHGNFIGNFLKTQIQIEIRYCHEMSAWPLKKSMQVLEDDSLHTYERGSVAFGTGIYAFSSYLNHSCAPNIGKVFINDKLVMVVQRPIESGSQIFENYGFSFMTTDKKFRKFELSERYIFDCTCEACINNFPLLPYLKIIDKACFKKAKKITQELLNLNKKKAMHKIKETGELIEKYHHNFPSLEVSSLIESFIALVDILIKPEIQFE